jgi:hypothetical protein
VRSKKRDWANRLIVAEVFAVDASHFQYEGKERFQTDQLFQGDILERTGEVEDVLKTLYPYAHQNPEKYPFFVVLTQSCDLVANDQRYRKAEHITLCAARSIRLFLKHEVSKLQTPVLKELRVCLTRDKPGLLQKIERLLSNEEYPYFYLHPSEETPFSEGIVAYLRVTFPLRTDFHYDACLKAKRVQLAPEFQAKLGWLTTLVFGRVATKDFTPDVRGKHANEYIDSIQGIEWRKAKALANEARRKGFSEKMSKLTLEQFRELIAAVDETSQLDVVARLIAQHAREVWPDNEEKIETFRRRLSKDPDFQAYLGD